MEGTSASWELRGWSSGVLAGLLIGCAPSVASLSLEEPSERLLHERGVAIELLARAVDVHGQPVEPERLRWRSSAPDIADVNGPRVVALRSGRATIEVESDGHRARTSIVVAIPHQLDVRPSELELFGEGRVSVLTARVLDENRKRILAPPLSWQSSNEQVARIEGDKVIGVGPGIADLTARVGTLRRSVPVTVWPRDLARLSVSTPRVLFKKVGESQRVAVRPLNSQGQPIGPVVLRWYSSNSLVAEVSPDGTLHARGPGRTVVTITAGPRKAAVEVRVP